LHGSSSQWILPLAATSSPLQSKHRRRRPGGGVGLLHHRRSAGHQLVMAALTLTRTASTALSTTASANLHDSSNLEHIAFGLRADSFWSSQQVIGNSYVVRWRVRAARHR
jgi:hypothetical protein